MSRAQRTTLTQFLIDERRRFPSASGDFNGLVLDIASACKAIARAVAYGNLDDLHGNQDGGAIHPDGEPQRKVDVYAHDCFVRFNEARGTLSGIVSQELAAPRQIEREYRRGKYLLLIDPLGGASNIDVNAPASSIFSILRAPEPGRDVVDGDFFQRGDRQVAAGYALYGASTMFVLSVGNGVHGFTLDPVFGDFLLTHPGMRIPEDTQEFAINASNRRFWENPVKRYVDECLQGTTGPRGKDFSMRWIASMVADAHRLLVRGGVYLYPQDNKVPPSLGHPGLLYDANPLAFLVTQAGGRASTGLEPVLGIEPTSLHQRVGFVFGSRNEVERLEHYHGEPNTPLSGAPLFGERGLFRE